MEAGLEFKEMGGKTDIEIMVPLVSGSDELKEIKKDIQEIANRLFAEKNNSINFQNWYND